MKPIEITSSNFETEVTQSEKPVILDFWAPWCGPCRALTPILEELAQEAGHIKIGKVNIDENPELAAKFGVMSIPMLAAVENGKILNQSVGVIPKEAILEMVKS